MEALLGREGTASSRTLHFFGFRLVNSQPNTLYNVLFLSHKRARHHVIADEIVDKTLDELISTTTRRRKDSDELLSRHAAKNRKDLSNNNKRYFPSKTRFGQKIIMYVLISSREQALLAPACAFNIHA